MMKSDSINEIRKTLIATAGICRKIFPLAPGTKSIGANATMFIMFFSFVMGLAVEGVLSRAAREALLTVPLIAACDVVFFIATMGADDFMDFVGGFLMELILYVVLRLVYGSVVDLLSLLARRAVHF